MGNRGIDRKIMITQVIPYYKAPLMLREQLRHWSGYPEGTVCIILVDDGSPKDRADEVIKSTGVPDNIEFKLYRILQNIPWNLSGATNLGMHNAESDWCLISAIDHVLPVESVKLLMERQLNPFRAYQFARYDVGENGKVKRQRRGSSGNIYLVTRSIYWSIGGYNEDFAGYFGGISRPFRRALWKVAEQEILEDVKLLHYPYLDGFVNDWHRRKMHINKNKTLNKKLKTKNYESTNHLRFDWEQII